MTTSFKLPYKKPANQPAQNKGRRKHRLANISLASLKDHRAITLILIAAGVVLAIVGGVNYFHNGNVKGEFTQINANVNFPYPDQMSTYFSGYTSNENPGTWNNPWYLHDVDWTGILIFDGVSNVRFYNCIFQYNNFALTASNGGQLCENFTFINCTFNSPSSQSFYLDTKWGFRNITFVNTVFDQGFGIGYSLTPVPSNNITIVGCEFVGTMQIQGSHMDATTITNSKFHQPVSLDTRLINFHDDVGVSSSAFLYVQYGNFTGQNLHFNQGDFMGDNVKLIDSSFGNSLQIFHSPPTTPQTNVSLINVIVQGQITLNTFMDHLTFNNVTAPSITYPFTNTQSLINNSIIENTRLTTPYNFEPANDFRNTLFENSDLYPDSDNFYNNFIYNCTNCAINNCTFPGFGMYYFANVTMQNSHFNKTVSSDQTRLTFNVCNYTTISNTSFDFNSPWHLFLGVVNHLTIENSRIPGMKFYNSPNENVSGLVINNCTSLFRTVNGGSDFVDTQTKHLDNVLVENSHSSYWYVSTLFNVNNITFVHNDIDAIWISTLYNGLPKASSVSILNNIIQFRSDLINSSHPLTTIGSFEPGIGVQVDGNIDVENNMVNNACSGIFAGYAHPSSTTSVKIINNTISHAFYSYYSIMLYGSGPNCVLANNSVNNFKKIVSSAYSVNMARTISAIASGATIQGNIVANSLQGALYINGNNNIITNNVFYNSSKTESATQAAGYSNSIIIGTNDLFAHNVFVCCTARNTAPTSVTTLLYYYNNLNGVSNFTSNTFINNKLISTYPYFMEIYSGGSAFYFTNNTLFDQTLYTFGFDSYPPLASFLSNYWNGAPGGASSNGIWYNTPYTIAGTGYQDSHALVSSNLHNSTLSFISPGFELLQSMANPLNITVRCNFDKTIENLLQHVPNGPIVTCNILNTNTNQVIANFLLAKQGNLPAEPGKSWEDASAWSGFQVLQSGTYTITISLYDLLGNNVSISRTFLITSTMPIISVTSPSPQSLLGTNVLNLVFTAQTQAGNGFKEGWLSITNGTYASAPYEFASWSPVLQNVSYSSNINLYTAFGVNTWYGIYQLNITLVDNFGHATTTIVEIGIELNTYNPTVTLVSPGIVPVPTNMYLPFNITIKVQDTMPFSGYSMQVTLVSNIYNGGYQNIVTYPIYHSGIQEWVVIFPAQTYLDGSYNFTIVYSCMYGGTQILRTTLIDQRIVDFSPPTISFGQLSNGTLFRSLDNQVSGSVVDGNNITSITMKAWNSTWSWQTTLIDPVPTHTWYKDIDSLSFPSNMTDGTYMLRIVAQDNIGDSAQVNFIISLDLGGPTYYSVVSNRTSNIWAGNDTSLSVIANLYDGNGINDVSANIVNFNDVIVGGSISFVRMSSTEYLATLQFVDWSSLLTDGTYQLSITATDAFNIASIYQFSFIVNWMNPSINIVSPANGIIYPETNLAAIISDGNGIASASIFIQNKSWSSFSTSLAFNGYEWGVPEALLPTVPANGYYNFIWQAYDNAGGTSTLNVTMTVDLYAPVINVLSPTYGIYNITSIIASANVSDSFGIDRVWATCYQQSGLLPLYVNDTPVMLKAQGSDIYSASIPVPSRDGNYFIHFFANNTLGRTYDFLAEFVQDRYLPVLTIVSPKNNSAWTTQLLANITASDGNGIEYFEAIISNATWSLAVQGYVNNPTFALAGALPIGSYGEGKYSAYLWMNTTTGEVVAKNVTFYIDRHSPSVAILSPVANYVLSTLGLNVTAMISATCGIFTAWFTISNATWTSAMISLPVSKGAICATVYDTRSWHDGYYTLNVVANDTLTGQTTTVSIPIQLKNRHVPQLTVLSPGIQIRDIALLNFTARVIDAANDVARVWIVINNQTWQSSAIMLANVGNNQYSAYFNASVLQNALYYYTIRAQDLEGYSTSASGYFTLIEDAPQIYVISPLLGVEVTDMLNATASVKDSMGVYQVRGTLSNASWSLSFLLQRTGSVYQANINTTMLGDGDYNLLVLAINVVSKYSSENVPINIKNSMRMLYTISPANGTTVNLNNTMVTLQITSLNNVTITLVSINAKWVNGTTILTHSEIVYGYAFQFTCDFSMFSFANVSGTVVIEIQFSDEFSQSYNAQVIVNLNMTRISSIPVSSESNLGYGILFYSGLGVIGVGAVIGIAYTVKKRVVVKPRH